MFLNKKTIEFQIVNAALIFLNLILISISCKCWNNAVYVALFAELIRTHVNMFQHREFLILEDHQSLKYLISDSLISIKFAFILLIINLTF